jgi:Zn finger protein HypA/HybF involved in hydrogenase expression
MKSKIVAFIGYQRFKCIGKKDSSTKNGRPIRLLIMQSYCPDCGKRFETTITKRALKNNRSLNRRCEKCKQPRVTIPATRKRLFGLKSVHPEV